MPSSEKDAMRKTVAHVAPLFIFMLVMVPKGWIEVENKLTKPWYIYAPEQWLYPLQTIIGIAVLAFFWRHYDFKPVRGLAFAVIMALVGIGAWILPGHLFWQNGMEEGWWRWFGFTAREEGFDPNEAGSPGSLWYVLAAFMRFVRMVVVVALVEEIFWRGFLMRFLLDKDGDYWEQPFGKFSWVSLVVVTLLFMFAHHPSDYFGAIVYGLLTYWVAVRTKSLAACVVMHAVANLVLGIYVMATGQWGYW
jgi:CAAX prenyl protease-like protein